MTQTFIAHSGDSSANEEEVDANMYQFQVTNQNPTNP